MTDHKTRISELADVATCQRRVYLRAKYGEKETAAQSVARSRGIELHDRAERQSRPDDHSQDKRCYIATAVYGAEAWQTQALRDFRDTSLMKSRVGQGVVWMYYRLSPPLARAAAHSSWLGKAGRAILDPIVQRLKC